MLKKLMTLAIVVAGGVACATATPATSPELDPSVGRFVWQDLMTDDVDRAMSFYGALLGWDFEESSRLGERYVLVRAGGAYVAGIAHVDHPDDPDARIDQWLSYLAVTDVDSAAADASDAGGEVLVAPVDVGSTRAAIVADRQGALLGLVELPAQISSEAQQALDADTFIWRDYLADDVDDALAFYRVLAGFDAERSARGDGLVHYVLRRGAPRGGMFGIGNEAVEPNWLVYVKVDDAAAAAQRAEQLGGRVIVPASADIDDGATTVVADPGGAGIALQQWSATTTEGR